MGVIEAALEKLRRGGAAPAATGGQSTGSAFESWSGAPSEGVSSGRQIMLDRSRLRAAGYLPELGEELRFADYYREIKRPIIRRALAANAAPSERLILVTSSLPAEGKTFTALNLAHSIARERDISVLLIDGDFPKSHISRALEIHEEPGLLDAVASNSLDVESLVLRTDVKGLDILPGGRSTPGGAVELVASARMSEITGRLLARNPRRLVIIDSSPLLVSSEARALIQLPSQIILVAQSGLTPRRALQDSIAQIDRKKLQGLVLNNVHAKTQNQYYGYPKSAKTEAGGDID
jgi:Mrp family chromosome partitioning ATPase